MAEWGPAENRAMFLGIARNRIHDNRGKEPLLSAELAESMIVAVENAITDLEGGNTECALNHLRAVGCLGRTTEGADSD